MLIDDQLILGLMFGALATLFIVVFDEKSEEMNFDKKSFWRW